MDSGVKDIIAGWSVEALKQAYVEARARHQKKFEPIKVKADFNEFGLLTITFSSSVIWPSYLIEEALGGQKQGARDLADVFWNSNDYLLDPMLTIQDSFVSDMIEKTKYNWEDIE